MYSLVVNHPEPQVISNEEEKEKDDSDDNPCHSILDIL